MFESVQSRAVPGPTNGVLAVRAHAGSASLDARANCATTSSAYLARRAEDGPALTVLLIAKVYNTTMPDHPLAYHITFGTYGTRLHGDSRGTVIRVKNKYGEDIIDRDGDWQTEERSRLRFPPRVFTLEQRQIIESLILAICDRGGWILHAAAARPDHTHVVLTADADGAAVRPLLKRWLGQALSKHLPLRPDQTFWAECGSVKWIWDDDYFGRATHYVRDQRATP